MFKLSESQNYLNHVGPEIRGNLPEAIRLIELCIEELKQHVEEDLLTLAFLLQRLGSLKYRNGEVDDAFRLYEKVRDMDQGSLLCELGYAKFLARDCAEFTKVIEKCDAVIAAVTDANYVEPEDSPSVEYYVREAETVKEECMGRME